MTKYLLRGVGGLGNRIFSLLTAIPYARLTGRKLVVEWVDTNYSDDGANVVHQYFRSPAFDPSGQVPQTSSVYPPVWREHLASADNAPGPSFPSFSAIRTAGDITQPTPNNCTTTSRSSSSVRTIPSFIVCGRICGAIMHTCATPIREPPTGNSIATISNSCRPFASESMT